MGGNMRNFRPVITLGLAFITLSAQPLFAKAQRGAVRAVTLMTEPQATDAQVHAAYPAFKLHPAHPSAVWLVYTTDTGCKFLIQEASYKPVGQAERTKIGKDMFTASWTGTACQKGQLIEGTGELIYGDANTRNTVGGRRDDEYQFQSGTMHKGVFDGAVAYTHSRDAARSIDSSSSTIFYYGGCYNLDPDAVMDTFPMCQPRLP